MNVKELDNSYIANTYSRFPVTIKSGKGSIITDDKGKKYIDLATGIAVNTFGIADEKWKTAIINQINQISHTSNLYYSEPDVKLAELICKKTGMKKVFFSNSGAEANECAIKVARKYAFDKKGKDYSTIITLKNSFHGRTITTLAATGQDIFHKDFLPLTEGFDYAIANDINDFKKVVKRNKTAAVMFECIQGEGGVIPLDKKFVKEIYEYCNYNDVLLIIDEVQTGNGRTGTLYCYEQYGINPDIVTTAKGIGGGLPLGVTMFSNKTKDVLTSGTHGSTFGGNPVCCAGAYSILNRIDANLLKEVTNKGTFIINSLKNCKGIKNITGLGLMLGIETEKDASEIINYCINNGVLVIKAKNKVRLLPALNIPYDLLEKALNIIKNACE